MPRLRCLTLLTLLSLLLICGWLAASEIGTPRAADWPQWQGPDRTAVSHEHGLLQDWPKDGPPLKWKAKGLGDGFSTPSVAAGRIFTMSVRGDQECALALAEDDGHELWVAELNRYHGSDGGFHGPRCTPTVDGELIYALGVGGDLNCLDAATGHVRWHKDLVKEFHGRIGGWGYSESPLIDGEKLICTPGGSSATLVALDKMTGKTIWTAKVPGGDAANYSSCIAADWEGLRMYVQFLAHGVVGVAAADGKFLWRYDKPANGTANCSTPLYRDGLVFAASSYGVGGGLVRLTHEDDHIAAKQVYFTKKMRNHHGGMVLIGDYLYGSNEGLLACLEFRTGKLMWDDRKPGKGSIAAADHRLYYRNEGGPVYLVEATPTKFVLHGQFKQPERSKRSAWPHPVVANGCLYLRDQDLLLCYDVKRK